METVAKLTNHHDYMDRLFKKGLLKRIAEGRAFRYSWKYSPEKPERAETFDGFRRLLGTSQAPFHLSHLVEVVGAQRFV